METRDNNTRPLGELTGAPGVTGPSAWGWCAQDIAELYRVADHLGRLGLPVTVYTGQTDEGDPWAVFEQHGTCDVVVHVARIDASLVVVDVARDRMYRGADFRAVADQLMDDVVAVVPPSPRDRGNVVMHPRMAMTTFVAAALVAAGLADPASPSAYTSSDALPGPDPDLLPAGSAELPMYRQDPSPVSVFPSDTMPVIPATARTCDASLAACAVADNPVLPRSEPSERLTGRDVHGMSAAPSYGGMGMGAVSVGLTALMVHLAPSLSVTPDTGGNPTMPEEDLLTWAFPLPDGDMQRLLSAPADVMFNDLLHQTHGPVSSAGQSVVRAQAAETVFEQPDGTMLSAVAQPPARSVDTAVYSMFLERPLEDHATAPKPPVNAVSTAMLVPSETSMAHVPSGVSSVSPVSARAPDAVSAAKSVVIFDHVVASIWGGDPIALLGFGAEIADSNPDGLSGGAIVVQMRLQQTDTRADNGPDGLPEDALTVARPTAAPDVAASASMPLMVPETYILANTLSNQVTLSDDATNVVVYIGGVVGVLGFTLGRDRIVMIEDAAGPDWLYSVDILGPDVVLAGVDGGSVTLFGAAATML